jgi:hexokinase
MSRNLATETERFLSRVAAVFRLSLADIREIIGHFHREMERGLAGEQSSLKMIPTFAGRPTGTEKGDFLALDLGGTNLRALEVALDGNGHASLKAAERFVIPPALMGGNGKMLFDFVADCVKTLFRNHNNGVRRSYDLAFTFSFPVEQLSIASGKLISWTKGFTAAGVEGNDVAELLSEALERKGMGFIHVAALTNDTVGTLAAGSYADSACDMGVILGTGTNACYPEKSVRIRKRPELAASRGEMIVNIEWGNFDKGKANRYDQILDGASPRPGKQQLEKMVSGLYIGELARLVIVEMMARGFLLKGADPSAFAAKYSLSAEQMAIAARGDDFLPAFGLNNASALDRKSVSEICRIVSMRSARLAGAAIAAVVSWMDVALESRHAVAIDGSLFEKYPEFQDTLRALLHELLGERAAQIAFVPVRDGSGVGAAIIAAVASFPCLPPLNR